MQRLVDSLVHDVRNPLNALSINLDVLTEKLRREQGEIPASQEKNLKVMREQIFRVDGILKQFSEYLAPKSDPGRPTVDLSEVLKQVLHILGHECRRSMIKVRQMVEEDLRIAGDGAAIRFVALQALFRAVGRAGQEGELDVTLQRGKDVASLRIRDSASDAREPFAFAPAALEALCAELGASLKCHGAELHIEFPLV